MALNNRSLKRKRKQEVLKKNAKLFGMSLKKKSKNNGNSDVINAKSQRKERQGKIGKQGKQDLNEKKIPSIANNAVVDDDDNDDRKDEKKKKSKSRDEDKSLIGSRKRNKKRKQKNSDANNKIDRNKELAIVDQLPQVGGKTQQDDEYFGYLMNLVKVDFLFPNNAEDGGFASYQSKKLAKMNGKSKLKSNSSNGQDTKINDRFFKFKNKEAKIPESKLKRMAKKELLKEKFSSKGQKISTDVIAEKVLKEKEERKKSIEESKDKPFAFSWQTKNLTKPAATYQDLKARMAEKIAELQRDRLQRNQVKNQNQNEVSSTSKSASESNDNAHSSSPNVPEKLNNNSNKQLLQEKLSSISFNKLVSKDGKDVIGTSNASLNGAGIPRNQSTKGIYNVKRLLKKTEAKQKRLEQLREEGKEEEAEDLEWSTIEAKALGVKVHDDPKKLQRKLKLLEKKKKQSKESWKEKKRSQKDSQKEALQKRNENLKARKQAQMDKRLKQKGLLSIKQ